MVQVKNISNSNPNVNITTERKEEPLVIGNLNSFLRYIGTFIIILFITICFFYERNTSELSAQSMELGILKEKVLFLEDIVINKTYVITKGEGYDK